MTKGNEKDSNRVVITGLGVLSSIGSTIDDLRKGFKEGKSGVSESCLFDSSGYSNAVACEVHDFDPSEHLEKEQYQHIDRTSQFALAAAKMAILDAGFKLSDLSGSNTAVCVGTTDGESRALDKLAEQWAGDRIDQSSEALIRKSDPGNLSFRVSNEFSLAGESITLSTACSSGNYAIGYGYDLLKSGDCSFALCGGSDSTCRKTYTGFSRLGNISHDQCRPFDKQRKGIVVGEGAGILLMETLESAKKRGAKIYAEILGYGLNCDADHMVSPNKNSIVECIKLAHKNAGITQDQVDYICAHGTGTTANDTTESGAICEVFGDQKPPVSSIKSMIGHTMGAASAIGAISCVLAIHEGFLPPTINLNEIDPECDIDCIPNQFRRANVSIVQNNGFAFGGNNAITIFSKFE